MGNGGKKGGCPTEIRRRFDSETSMYPMTVTCQLKSKGIGIEGIYRVIKIENDIEY